MRTYAKLLGLGRLEMRKLIAGLGLNSVAARVSRSDENRGPSSPPTRALRWLADQEHADGGIKWDSRRNESYPEVTGYLIPTLINYGELAFAHRLADWLVRAQQADGSYRGLHGRPYVFDTGQALRGLLAAQGLVPGCREAVRRASNYILSMAIDGGRSGFIQAYDGEIPEGIHLYVLPPLIRAGGELGNRDQTAIANRCLDFYCASHHAPDIDGLTHFLGYQLEALIDLAKTDRALSCLQQLASLQKSDGSIRGKAGRSWICTPGLAQLAVCWYKTGQWTPADKAMSWLDNNQEPSGGFRGSYGWLADYSPLEEIPWAAKFYLDAHLRRLRAHFERDKGHVEDSVSSKDGRLRALADAVPTHATILDAGCGKGRFSSAITEEFRENSYIGIDIARANLQGIKSAMALVQASLEALPFKQGVFDLAFSIEALEHSPNPDVATKEIIRVTRPGGLFIIIDKQAARWGALRCPAWEQWPERDRLAAFLSRFSDTIEIEPLAFDDWPKSSEVMLKWQGRKRDPGDSEQGKAEGAPR